MTNTIYTGIIKSINSYKTQCIPMSKVDLKKELNTLKGQYPSKAMVTTHQL